jgi:hypothetical protein
MIKMAVETINYADKSAINTNPDIVDTNKVNATDMNEIKSVVNNNASILGTLNYNVITDGTEVKTGRQVDGKDEYVKRYSFTRQSSGDQTLSKSLGFTLSDVMITSLDGTAKSNTNNWFNINIGDYYSAHTYANLVELKTDNTIELRISANFTYAYIEVKYIYIN